MKVNYVRYSASWKAFLGILLAACFLATAAHADSLFTGKFKLTNEVHWGKAVLSPGAYSLALDQWTHTIIVRDAQTSKIVARVFARTNYNTKSADSEMLIAVRGRQRAVYSLQVAGLGEVFNQAHPFGARRRAAEEARNAEAIPVEVAKK
jgi:hypothetical protein